MTFKKKIKTETTWVQKKAVMVIDVPALIRKIVVNREIQNPLIKLGIDSGQGSLKFCISIVDISGDGLANSVNDVFIIFLAQNVQENKYNLRYIWNLLKLDELQNILICVDLKVANILAGIMSHSSRYPCTWCLATCTGKRFDENAEMRTIGLIREH